MDGDIMGSNGKCGGRFVSTEKVRLRFIVLIAVAAFQFGFAVSGDCQAWVAPKHSGSIAISYLNDFSNKDYFGHGENYIITPVDVTAPDGTFYPRGTKIDEFGEVRTQGVYFDFSYSLTDKLAVSASLPYLAPKYTGADNATSAFFVPHRFPDGSIQLDDGHYHGSFADIGLRLRYNITARPFMITPFVEYNGPSHDYLFYSHAIVGRHVNSLGLGSYFGGTLDRAIPNAYLQGRYEYTFDEKILGISRHRSLGEVEFGYFVTPPIRAFMILAGQITHGGLNAPYGIPGPPVASNEFFFHHTQITRDNYLNIGFGGQYSLNDRVDFFGVVSHMLTARNLHGLTYGINFGFSWGFGGSPQRPCHC